MNCSPLNARHVGTVVPHVLKALRRRFPNVRNDMLLDAASAAVERCITSGFLQLDKSPAEVFRWLRTATVYELLRELRTARRYADFETHAAALDTVACQHSADTGASRHVLQNWLVRRFGEAVAETLWLHTVENCPPRDIAAIQCTNVKAIKARITRARKVIRRASDVLK